MRGKLNKRRTYYNLINFSVDKPPKYYSKEI